MPIEIRDPDTNAIIFNRTSDELTFNQLMKTVKILTKRVSILEDKILKMEQKCH